LTLLHNLPHENKTNERMADEMGVSVAIIKQEVE
jgi:hypothetical protein